jgi:hypothetical protein
VKRTKFSAPNFAIFFVLTLFLHYVPSWKIAVNKETQWEPMVRPRGGPFPDCRVLLNVCRQIMRAAENYRLQFYIVVTIGTEQFCALKKKFENCAPPVKYEHKFLF